MRCKYCGEQNNNTSRFCITCGRPLFSQETKHKKIYIILICCAATAIVGAILTAAYFFANRADNLPAAETVENDPAVTLIDEGKYQEALDYYLSDNGNEHSEEKLDHFVFSCEYSEIDGEVGTYECTYNENCNLISENILYDSDLIMHRTDNKYDENYRLISQTLTNKDTEGRNTETTTYSYLDNDTLSEAHKHTDYPLGDYEEDDYYKYYTDLQGRIVKSEVTSKGTKTSTGEIKNTHSCQNEFTYNENGDITFISLDNQRIEVSLSYDDRGNLTNVVEFVTDNSNKTKTREITHEYNDKNQKIYSKCVHNSEYKLETSRSYEYDENDNLVKTHTENFSYRDLETSTTDCYYEYENGRMIRENEYLYGWNNSHHTISYDKYGNMISDTGDNYSKQYHYKLIGYMKVKHEEPNLDVIDINKYFI